MTKLDPIIAVKNIKASAKWYQEVFEYKNTHEGDHFGILVDENDEVMLCLHLWEADEHPSMANPNILPGNGIILYFRTNNMEQILSNIKRLAYPIEENIHRSQNSMKKEFSIKDPDGYYLTISEFHQYQG